MQRFILVGGGHAQLSVLRELSRNEFDVEVMLVTPSVQQTYSGMLPGWMAGHYTLDECHIDLRPLAEAAKVKLVLGSVVGIDPQQRIVKLSDGSRFEYDKLSLDIGSVTNTSWLQEANERLLPIKPLDDFVQRWGTIISTALKKSNYRLAIVGGGAAGVELAFAARYAFTSLGIKGEVILVASEQGVLPGHANSVKRRAIRLISQRGIRLYQSHAVGVADGLQLANGGLLAADCVIAATGARPADWLNETGLAKDERGYILVDAQQRSVSHQDVYAAGDICAREDIYLPRSGVHAVFAGPILANNLLAELRETPMRRYLPRRRSLYLLATGPKHAIASWGRFSAQGHWVWRWKNFIDQRFMRKNSLIEAGKK